MHEIKMSLRCRLVQTDWSGTISDDRLAVYNANIRILTDYGLCLPSYEAWLTSPATNAVEFLMHAGIPLQPEELRRMFEKYFEEESAKNPPAAYNGAEEFLRQISKKGRKIAVVSSHPSEKIEEEAMEYGVRQFISGIFGNSMNKTDTILEACIAFDTPPEHAVYVCDMVGDIRHARAAGVLPVCVAHGYHSYEALEKELGSSEFISRDLVELGNGRLAEILG